MKTVTEAVRSVPLRSLLTGFLPAAAAFLLSGAALDGLYSPWALAAVSAAGVSWPGLSALLGAGLGAFLFLDFQAGLRHTAAAILIFCANTAFCTTRLYRRPVFRPVAAVLMTLLVQSAYLIQRQPRQWALCAAACTVLYAAAALLPSLSDANASAVSRGQALFLLGLGLSLTAYGWSFSGFRVGGMLAAALLMAAAKCLSPASAAAAGAVAGLTMDLFTGDAVLLTVVCCGGMGAASAVRERGRLAVPLVYTAAAMAGYVLLDAPDPLPLLFQSMAGPRRRPSRRPPLPLRSAPCTTAFSPRYRRRGRRIPPCCSTARRSRSAQGVYCSGIAGRHTTTIPTMPSTTPAPACCAAAAPAQRTSPCILPAAACTSPSCWRR